MLGPGDREVQEASGDILHVLSSIWGCTMQNSTLQKLRNFDARYPPQMPIGEFIKTRMRYMRGTPSAYSVAMVYLLKVLASGEMRVSQLNVHRLYAICHILAIKYFEDEVYDNAFYARAVGLPMLELNALEVTILKLLDWKVRVTPEERENVCENIVEWARTLRRYQQRRGERPLLEDEDAIIAELAGVPPALAKGMVPPPKSMPVASERAALDHTVTPTARCPTVPRLIGTRQCRHERLKEHRYRSFCVIAEDGGTHFGDRCGLLGSVVAGGCLSGLLHIFGYKILNF
eukprot:TRINITY_DN63717_c0_g1_i1.p1 TRINITY_DN63717_c0_g1~~TRINITY_DN63717_c0_g1_i1.p1  ORF type:complete len:320 (+),score=48.70 TRINITY_DN63717_c0_g1_i1:96-962(+)